MSKSTRGGGAHRKPILDMIEDEFGKKLFTLADLQTRMSGICRALLTDLINSGDVKVVKEDGRKTHYPLEYKFIDKNETVVKRR